MATKKRQVPQAVKDALERKQRQNATLAELQSAALPSARKQLEPLRVKDTGRSMLKITSRKSEEDEAYSRIKQSLNMSFQKMLQQSVLGWASPPSVFGTSHWMTRPSFYESGPTISTDLLESLKSATPHKVEPKVTVPDMVECITAWRGWSIGKEGLLCALGQSTIWQPKNELVATCEASGHHRAPQWSCSCGVWAFKDVDRLVAAIGGRYSTVKVIGSVSLWGRVIETENGYRAEKAYPSELWLLDNSLEELGLIYDVPIRTITSPATT